VAVAYYERSRSRIVTDEEFQEILQRFKPNHNQ
jgi:hypothetical protein